MKKLLINLYIMAFIFFSQAAFADFNSKIEEEAIEEPLSLTVWYPHGPPIDAVFIESAANSAIRFLAPFAPPVVGKITNFIKGNPSEKQESDSSKNINNKAYSPITGYEEILYDMEFKNSPQTPICVDTVMFIRIPKWLRYTENSFRLNDVKLSDKEDKDKLTYINNKSLLKIDLSKLKKKEEIKISFNAQILDKNKIQNNPFCFVKFDSVINNISTEWKQFPFVNEGI